MAIPNGARGRAVVGGLIGFIVFSVDAFATLIRFVFNPFVAERATAGAVLAMSVFLLLFVATGAVAGYLWLIQVRLLRFVVIGALVGALVWSYLTITWPITARPSAMILPSISVLSAMLIGAGGGALGGVLLFVIVGVRRPVQDHR